MVIEEPPVENEKEEGMPHSDGACSLRSYQVIFILSDMSCIIALECRKRFRLHWTSEWRATVSRCLYPLPLSSVTEARV